MYLVLAMSDREEELNLMVDMFLFFFVFFMSCFIMGMMQRHDIVNTAILTSRQVSEPLRVFVVTQAGKVADVTLQASCSSADESVLKVILNFFFYLTTK